MSFPVPGRSNLPQYRWLHKNRTGVAYFNRHPCMTIADLHQKGRLSGTWSIPSPSRKWPTPDGAPGPDRRSLSGLKRLWREEVAAHFNVWLLAGYPPVPLRRGETVLIAKEQGATSPEKQRPITLSDTILRCFHNILASRFETTCRGTGARRRLWKGWRGWFDLATANDHSPISEDAQSAQHRLSWR